MAPFCIRHHFHRNKQIKNRNKKSAMRSMQRRFERLKSHIEEISKEQKSVREGQKRLKDQFEEIGRECEGLKRETRLIVQQSARNQIKLAIMFRILKARQHSDFATAAGFTHLLREIVQKENEERDASDDNEL